MDRDFKDGQMIKEISVKEFANSGLLWFVNTILHLFGIAISYDPETFDIKIQACKFRGFSEENNTIGYKKITNYLKNNINEIAKDIIDDTENKNVLDNEIIYELQRISKNMDKKYAIDNSTNKVEIDLKQNGTGSIKVNGVDYSNLVSRIYLSSAPGEMPQLEIASFSNNLKAKLEEANIILMPLNIKNDLNNILDKYFEILPVNAYTELKEKVSQIY